MTDKLFKGLVILAVGSVTARTVLVVRDRKMKKQMYNEMADVIEQHIDNE